MIDYKNGKIYKVINALNEDVYVGSTVKKLCNRMGGHRSHARDIKWTSKLYLAMREIGIAHFSIVLVEMFPCTTKEELHAREVHWIKALKATYNHNLPFKTPEEHAMRHIMFRIKNKEKLNAKSGCVICGTTVMTRCMKRHQSTASCRNNALQIE